MHYQKQQSSKADKGTLPIIIVCVGGLCAMAVVLIRKVRRRRKVLRGLPQPPNELALSGYKHDIRYRDYDFNDDDGSDSSGETGYKDALPHLA